MKKLTIMFSLVYFALGSFAKANETKPFTKDVADEIATHAMMASNAYVGDARKIYFPVEMLGWKKVDMKGNPVAKSKNSYSSKTFVGKVLSNLQFDIWEHTKFKETIIAFKGTNEKIDWIVGDLALGIAIPYKSAKKQVRKYIDSHPDRTVSLAGHSLGGSVALSVSFWEGVDTIVFNTSPRIFDGMEDNNKRAKRLSVFQEGDIVQRIRKRYPKFLEKIHPAEIVMTRFNYSGGNAHNSDFLAQGILSCSKESNLQELAKSVKLKIKCPLK